MAGGPDAERKARRLKWVEWCWWGCLGAAILLGGLASYWSPLWVVSTVLLVTWLVVLVLGWVGVLGWFALDIRPRRKKH
jgi:hypothetical protein